MNVSDVVGANNSGFPSNVTTNERIMGKDDFLKLLVMQLSNQDPLNPQSPEDFSAQLAQFSSLEQLSQMNDLLEATLETNLLLTTSVNNTLAANYIGKQVKALGSETYFDGNAAAPVMYEIPRDAKNVTIEILDASGKVIRSEEFSAVKSGEHTFEWDGKDKAGKTVAQGNYQFRVSATDVDGNSMSAVTYMSGMITGVRYSSSGAMLLLGNTTVSLGNVLEIILPQNTAGTGNTNPDPDPDPEPVPARDEFFGQKIW